ncbi:MAG: SPOR domain-containing protein [Proteobacteria bacterium]|nr:SPOR domain-containing protein [Pseudomonadota bacterium]MDA1331697.1 SPOR domain-containing protein [Pseudomonadota bacterium]
MLAGEEAGELELKKQARRRLVGAIALVLLVVTLVPLLLDNEPKKISDDVEINIISTSGSVKSSEVASLSRNAGLDRGHQSPDLPKSIASAQDGGVNSKNSSLSQANVETDSGYVVQLGAFSKEKKALSLVKKLQDNGFSVISERFEGSSGPMTRVSVGVLSSMEEAENTRKRLEFRKLTVGDTKITRSKP